MIDNTYSIYMDFPLGELCVGASNAWCFLLDINQ